MAGLAGILAGWPAPLRLAALLLAALLVLLPGQAALPPTDRDEARFVQATKQMMETGDFIDIRFQNEARHKKPVGIYWLQAAAASALGGTEAPVWAYRLPSLLGMALAIALTAWAVAPLVGAQTAVLAALLLGATVLPHVEARIAKTDAALLATVVLAQGALLRIWLAGQTSRGLAVLFWGALAAGILLKGPVILLPVLGTLVWMAVAERRLPLRAFKPLLGLGVLALLVGPWVVAITVLSEGAFWSESVGQDMLAKVLSGQEAHGAPPGTYLSLFFGTFWPFAVLAPFAILWLWSERRSRTAAFLMGWIVPSWLVFELVPTKLPHYVLVTYPAIATVMAAALPVIAARAMPERWLRGLLLAGWAIPALALVVAAALAVPVIEGRFAPWAAGLAVAAAVPLALAGRALWRWQVMAFAGLTAAGAVLVYAAMFQFALPGLTTGFVAPRMADAVAQWRCGVEGPVAVTSYSEPSVVVALGTDTILTDGAGAGVMLSTGRAPLVFVGDADMAGFAGVAGARATALTRVEGFNYSKGRKVALTLYGWDRDPGARCGG